MNQDADEIKPIDKEIIENVDDVILEPLDEDGDELSPRETIKKLRQKLKDAIKEKQDNLLGWQRMKADYSNLQRTLESQLSESENRSRSKIIRDFLPVLDSFDQAMANEESWNSVDKSWRVGVEYIRNQLIEALTNNGVELFGVAGETFDPKLHQPLEHDGETRHDKNEVIKKVLQRGVMFRGLVIRPAKVITSSN